MTTPPKGEKNAMNNEQTGTVVVSLAPPDDVMQAVPSINSAAGAIYIRVGRFGTHTPLAVLTRTHSVISSSLIT